MKKTIVFILICFLYVPVHFTNAQIKSDKRSDVKIRMEKIKEKCKDLPLDERIRVSVARFSATASNAPSVLGENMSTMFTNALSQVNCFNVLEEQKNLEDMTGEIDASGSEYFDATTGIEKGKMKLAQLIVTGEVTEYNDASTGTKVLGIGGSVSKARIGFILKIINPRTREILKSTSINTESTKGKSFRVSFISKSVSSNPAVADALEKGIIAATEYLADELDNIPLPSDEELNSNFTTLEVHGVSFSGKSTFLNLIKNNSAVVKAELARYADNTAIYSVRHTGSTDELATMIDANYGEQYEITGVQSGKIEVKMK
ncbi:Curli production assembly/transport component CsgG [Saccharicrinis carchari]|uniref:Curli production assembly/transport component CsgG n=1 Tax=Saccharicrinis carchari TaxID=1168039 RepID=A0A521C7T4_SACCC|nr:CsgG/HfaB family protein [Saccharicrinis carchari]SMO54861.1 Curli production assembly/transport component CsgG [Saccharicrinis carchari]